MPLRLLQYLGVFSALTLLAACASAPAPVKTPEANYKEAENYYASGRYEEAINQYKKVKEAYSSPELTTQAELKIADAHFDNKAYVEAAAAYEDFRKLHPKNENSPYALYRLALSHYLQITGIDVDQTPVKNAVFAMEAFLTQYPSSQYAEEVKQKLADCRMKQLEYENYVGNFYLRTGKYEPAIKRLNDAVLRFPGTPKLDETYYYLGKAYLKSGDKAQAKALYQKFVNKFPYSPFKEDVLKVLASGDL
jgi:outer membrane protein assembly factor BamD